METGVQSVIDYNALIEREAAAFFEAAARYLKPEDVQLLRQAFEVSREAHEGQTRKSGEPYITHPLAVATMLTDWRLDVQGLAAAFLLRDGEQLQARYSRAFLDMMEEQ